jgi:hypothetical protein
VGVVEGGSSVFVAELDEGLADREVAERGGEVEGRVGVARDGVVGVVEEVGVRVEDALDEEGIVRADGAAESEGRLYPGGVSNCCRGDGSGELTGAHCDSW